MQLVPVAAPPPPTAAAAAAPALDPTSDAVLAATVDGLLRLLPLDGALPRSFAIQVEHGGRPRPLTQPCAALCSLSGGGGLLLAQRGSGRLLFCPPLCELGSSSATDLFLFGTHEAPISAIAASSCGSFALTGDTHGGVKLWSLADGSLLGTAAAAMPGTAVSAACFMGGGAAATAHAGSSTVQVWSTHGSSLSLRTTSRLLPKKLRQQPSSSSGVMRVWYWARQAQQAGELLSAEVRPFTVVEHDTSLARSEFRQQRYARISRRCPSGQRQTAVAGPGTAEGQAATQPAAAEEQAAAQPAAAPTLTVALSPQQHSPPLG
ncbi:WD-40 repeat-containing [Chlorella sorokiniana]|uniref:WD-40 repeat-containing n=1 Tax=Chlorella sorokiniana TaxID=3076 RepID=A0A2P6TNB5_CHLSO|nr:WD-40 repeat-containing [Chlorella sorokiniana]|eukprot:PRW50826.1 WD-40 repeat-containing [Chlorella sorokiniana]